MEDLEEYIFTELITIEVENPGNLASQIPDGKKYLFSRLKIKGKINKDDLFFLKDISKKNLRYLDLSESKIVSGGSPIKEVIQKNPDSRLVFAIMQATLPVSQRTNYEPFVNVKIYYKEDSICEELFSWTDLEEIILPNSLTVIEQHAFSHMHKLKRIIINSEVVIRDYAFYDCPNLIDIVLNKSIQLRGERIFAGGDYFLDIDVKSLASDAFDGHPINMIKFREGNSYSINNNLLVKKDIYRDFTNYTVIRIYSNENIYFPENINIIEMSSMHGYHIKSVTFGENIERINPIYEGRCYITKVFLNCSKLKIQEDRVLPSGTIIHIDYMKNGIFNHCNISHIIISDDFPLPGAIFYTDSYEEERFGKTLLSITLHKVIPPIINGDPFLGVDKNCCVLYVPKQSLLDYWNAPYWRDFVYLKPIPEDVD